MAIKGAVSSRLSAPVVLITASVFAGVVGFFGPGFIGVELGSKASMYVGAICAGLTAAILKFFGYLSERRKAKKLEEAVVEPDAGEAAAADADGGASVDVMKAHFKRSLQAVKDSPHGKNALVTMPWYMLIGPPGAGKTSLMQNSSLTFPQIGLELQSVSGVGGTRNCDWWFTEEAIYLDTAGRYTSQLQSRKEWLGFLTQMSKLRRQRPISGIILTVGLDQLLNLPEDKVAGYAQEIRRRYDEVAEAIDFVFPVYIVFNKADLLEGFCDYFDHLGRNDRAEPLGFPLPFKRRDAVDVISDFRDRYRQLGTDLLHRRSSALNGANMS
ncbi:MAG: hypothetical protein HRU15_09340, partial [Planctomycetes bacterium]|nr:hypothetical protein [Planctomycetota bacterium]